MSWWNNRNRSGASGQSDDTPNEVSGPNGGPQQHEVAGPEDPDAPPVRTAVEGNPEGAPVRVELSGEVDVNVNHGGLPSDTAPSAGNALGSSDGGSETFEVRKQAESSMDTMPPLRVPVLDPVTGNRVTVSDVRQRYGDALDLSNRHRAYSNGVLRNDTYQPEPGEVLTWKEDSKSRGC